MRSATPLPGRLSQLALYGAEDLLTRQGCPVCHYEAGVDDRFLAWFALEGHDDASMITRLCESLGLCPRHTRGSLAQPGADARLTPVYRYLLQAARKRLTSGRPPRMGCPACARDAEGAARALGTLLTGLREVQVRDRYRALGGLCIPHLRAAARQTRRRDAAWIAEVMRSRLVSGQTSLAVFAGEADPDAEVRAQLRAGLSMVEPPAAVPGDSCPVVCVVCRAAAEVEGDCLARITGKAAHQEAGSIHACRLCAAHLQDTWAQSGAVRADAAASMRGLSDGFLASLREDATSWLAEVASAGNGIAVMNLLSRRRVLPRGGPAQCPVCRAAQSAAEQYLRMLSTAPRRGEPAVCVRHVFSLRELDSGAGEAAARAVIGRVDELSAGLQEAFRKRTWAHRHEARGHEMSAWKRAAAIIDGRVYGGGPPAPLQRF